MHCRTDLNNLLNLYLLYLQPRGTGRLLEYETLAAFGEQHAFDYLVGTVGGAHLYVQNV
jgi:hypothetical protein